MNDRLNELDLPLPPRRPLPPEVRSRVRGTVFRELDAPSRTRLDRIRPPLAVAASVAVLAAGAMIVTQSVGGSGDDPLVPPPSASATLEPPPMDPVAVQANLDRCAAAMSSTGKAAELPARDTWVPVFALPDQGRTVTAVRAAGVPLFCETTRTTVTVSNPNVAPNLVKGSETAALMISKDGAMAGVVDPAWQSMVVLSVSPGGGSESSQAIIKDGLWVQFTDMATGQGARFTVRRTIPGHPEEPYPVGPGGVSTAAKPGEAVPGQSHPELDLPRAPEPLVSVVDKPPAPPADRTSDLGKFLAGCMAKSGTVVIDPDVWEPVAIAGTAPYQAVLARSGDELATCAVQAIQQNPDDLSQVTEFAQFYAPMRVTSPTRPLQFVTSKLLGRDNEALLGLVRSDVASLQFLASGRDPVTATVENGAFAVEYAKLGSVPDRHALTVVMRDKSGNEVEVGLVSDYY